MKIAIVYNHDSQNVINLFGIPNKERIGQKTLKRISDALKTGGHQVKAIEADKNLIDRLENFMPRVMKGERPGFVFNISYGIQGQARYTHVPSILEMVGIPYVGSGPLAHGLALDKVVAKTIFKQNGLPTPDFAVLDSCEHITCDLAFPLIVKPKNESVSFGVTIVKDDKELKIAVQNILEKYGQPALVEQYIHGREINVGLIGNNLPEAFPPVELLFGKDGPPIYTYEDKTSSSGREIGHNCPAKIGPKKILQAQEIAQKAFAALGCYDFARVDMRMDNKGNFYILEINSLPSLGEHGSYLIGAEKTGLDFKAVINRYVDEASARYFGTPKPQQLDTKNKDSGSEMFSFLTQRREQIERQLRNWTNINSRSYDSLGIQQALTKLSDNLESIGLKSVEEFTNSPFVKTWQSKTGFASGTLLIGHLDIPLKREIPVQRFHRDPELIYGEGVGLSRAPLVMMEFVLRGLKHIRHLHKMPVGVLYYTDEGYDHNYSSQIIQAAAAKAKQVLVLRPGNWGNKVITQRRGQRRYILKVETKPKRLGKANNQPQALNWICRKVDRLSELSSRENRIAVAVSDIKTTSFPMLLPHYVVVTLQLSYRDEKIADDTESKIREILGKEVKWKLEMIADRPPMKLRRGNQQLLKAMRKIGAQWDIPIEQESSLWPTVAGLVPSSTKVLCGLGPVAKDLYTPQEAVQRISILQRTLLLAEFLIQNPKR